MSATSKDSTPADVPCRETAFIRREFDMPLAIEEIALVLVDVWNVHFIESWIERAARSMKRYGYNIVLLRDREVEQQYGFSVSNADFLAAISEHSGDKP